MNAVKKAELRFEILPLQQTSVILASEAIWIKSLNVRIPDAIMVFGSFLMNFTKLSFWVLAGLLIAASPASASLIGSYKFTAHSLAPTDADGGDGITFSNFFLGTGYGDLTDNGAPANALRLSGDDTKNLSSDAFASDAFFSFMITVAPGWQLDLRSIEVDNQATNTHQYSSARVFSDVQGFDDIVAETIGRVGRTGTGSDEAIQIDLIDLDDPTINEGYGGNVLSSSDFDRTGATTVTFYLPWIDQSNVDTRFTDLHEIRINGTAGVPEPSSLVVMGGLFALGMAGWRVTSWRQRRGLA